MKCLENKYNNLKVSYNYPYSQESHFNTKYTIFLFEGKKKYKIFKDEKIEGAKIILGNKHKYETEVKIDSTKKGQFVYIIADPKDSNINLRPRIIYKGEECQNMKIKVKLLLMLY